MKNIIAFIIIVFFYFNCCSQNILPKRQVVIFSGAVNLIDSEYILTPQLKMLFKNEKIKIPKQIYYDDVNNILADCKIYLQKQLPKVYTNISVDKLGERAYSEDAFKYREYSAKDKLSDSINLKYYYPFEIGKYRLRLQMKYYYKKKIYTMESDWIYFDVPYLPKDALFN